MCVYHKILCAIVSLVWISSLSAQVVPNKGMLPPPPAIAGSQDACSGKNENDLCAIAKGDQTINGSCHQFPLGSGPMICFPDYAQNLVDACNGKNPGEACSFTARNNLQMGGSCRKGAFASSPLVCGIGVPPDKQQ
jgi:hypothetical protein